MIRKIFQQVLKRKKGKFYIFILFFLLCSCSSNWLLQKYNEKVIFDKKQNVIYKKNYLDYKHLYHRLFDQDICIVFENSLSNKFIRIYETNKGDVLLLKENNFKENNVLKVFCIYKFSPNEFVLNIGKNEINIDTNMIKKYNFITVKIVNHKKLIIRYTNKVNYKLTKEDFKDL